MPLGRKPFSAAMNRNVAGMAVRECPANATHSSVRSMAEEMGISHKCVQLIWGEHGLMPSPMRDFSVSHSPDSITKVEDIVDLYIAPPEKALVLQSERRSRFRRSAARNRGAPEEVPCRHDDLCI